MFFLLSCVLPGAAALDNGLALTPPMGWRSWNCDHLDVSDAKIRATIDALTSRSRGTSLVDAGYKHVGTDDGWQACGTGYQKSFHADDGTPLVNKSAFPDLKALVNYGHSKGVLMGWYQINCHCLDEYTIDRDGGAFKDAAYAGDAKQVIDYGFDGVKIDNCGDDNGDGFEARMRHLNASSRPVLVENSNQGNVAGKGRCVDGGWNCPKRGNPTSRTDACPANTFRSGGDIGPSFGSILGELQQVTRYMNISRPGCWAYPDMLEVGNFGSGASHCDLTPRPQEWYATEEGASGVTESRTHFGAWCIVSSPLILGLDVTDTARLDSVWDIVTNAEAIAVNQQWAGEAGRLVRAAGDYQVWAKTLPGGDAAALVLNQGGSGIDVSVAVADISPALGRAAAVRARNIWKKADDDGAVSGGKWNVHGLGSHDSAFYRFSVGK